MGKTIAESDLTGSTTNSAYVEYIFFDGERIASRNGGSGAVNYYYTDQLGSIVTITDGSGNPCYEATFTPYGQEMATSASWTCSSNYKFTGYERDSETGLDYAFARYYNPRLGRFMSADPLSGDPTDPQSLNRYAYVENSPETFMDPWGLARCVLPDGTVSTAPNKRACKEEGGTWQPDPPPPGTIFPTCTGIGPCVIGPANPGGTGGGGGKQKPKLTKKQCIQSVLQNKFGNFIANKVIPEFSLYSLSSLSSAWSFLKGGALSLGIKGAVGGGLWGYGQVLTTTGQNLAAYPGLAAASADAVEAGAFWTTTAATAGTLLAGGVAAVTAFATGADYWARKQCQNVP